MKLRRGGSLVSKVHQVSGRVFHRLLREEGMGHIPPAQGRILFALWQSDAMTPSALAAKTLLDKASLTGLVDRLEKGGLVDRIPSPDDKRSTLVKMSPAARSLEASFLRVSERMISLYYEGMDDGEIDRFEKSLEKVLANCLRAEGAAKDGGE